MTDTERVEILREALLDLLSEVPHGTRCPPGRAAHCYGEADDRCPIDGDCPRARARLAIEQARGDT